MNYDREINYILAEAGIKGLSLKKITKHVFNNRNSLFETVSFEDVYRYVSAYLKRNSKNADSIIEKAETRGVYRINMSAKSTGQLMFDFKERDETDEKTKEEEDKSLFLF